MTTNNLYLKYALKFPIALSFKTSFKGSTILDLPECMAKSVIHVKKVRIHGANKALLEITLLRSTSSLGHRSIAYSSFDPKLLNFM